MPRVRALMLLVVFAASCLPLLTGCNSGSSRKGMVYAATNAAGGNEVIAYRRAGDGTLTFFNAFPTGGNGTGTTNVSTATPQTGIDPLVSQGSLAFSRDGRFLFAVNAGSSTITSFRVADDGTLTQADIKPSGGSQPNSLNEFNGLLYVSNVGAAANMFSSNVTGFRVAGNGTLTQITDSTHALSTPTAQPSRVLFNNDGSLLEVSELTTNRVSVFQVNADGTLTGPTVNTSNGTGPFGAFFLNSGRLLVAEAGAGALSSYNVAANGTSTVISGSVVNGQTATCWVFVRPDQRFAYTSNTGSGTLSSYNIALDGTLTIAENVASTIEGATSGPEDLGISGNNLYVLDGGLGAVTVFRVEDNGTLTKLQTITGNGLPALGAEGLVSR